MPSLTQKVDLLFKKFIAFKSGINISGGNSNSFTASTTPYSLEDNGSKQSISAEQVLVQTKYLPLASNPLNKSGVDDSLRSTPYIDTLETSDNNRPILLVDDNNILQRLDLSLTYVSGSTYAWKYSYNIGSSEWIDDFGEEINFKAYNIIPFSYEGTSTIYRYQLYKTKTDNSYDSTWDTDYTLTDEISFGSNDWFFDPDSLILNFLSETLPSGVTTSTTLYLRVYRYIGSILDPSDFGGNSLGSISTIYNKNMLATVTVDDGDICNTNTLSHTPSAGSYVAVKINGVSTILSDIWAGGAIDFDCSFVKELPNVISVNSVMSGSQIEFSSPHNLSSGTEIIYKDDTDILWASVDTVVSPTEIIISAVSVNNLIWLYEKKTYATIAQGDILLWFESNAGYNLDTNDRIDYEYVILI